MSSFYSNADTALTPFDFNLNNPLDFAPILFATRQVGLSKPWGTTGITLGGIQRASLVLMASEEAGQPWLLLKSDTLILVHRLLVDAQELFPSPDSEPVMVLAINGYLHRIHFSEPAAFWAFRYHSLHGGQPLERMRSAPYNYGILLSAWEHFNVPFDFPRTVHCP